MATAPVGDYAVFPSFNNKVPKEGPRFIPMSFDFTDADIWDVDLMTLQQAGKISTLQAFYIDNSMNTMPVTISMGLGGQNITLKAGTQGFVSAIVNNNPKFSVTSSGGTSVTIFALNYPVSNIVWATV